MLFTVAWLHSDGTITLKEQKLGADFKYTKQYTMRKDDILLSRIDCSKGSIAVVPYQFDGAVCSGEFHVLRSKTWNPVLLWYLLRSKEMSEHMLGLSTGMTGRHRINRDQFMRIRVPTLSDRTVDSCTNNINESNRLRLESDTFRKEALAILERELRT